MPHPPLLPPCDDSTVRVTISFSSLDKHMLPVEPEYDWSHNRGTAKKNLAVCTPAGVGAPKLKKKQADLWKCLADAACRITDDRLQISVLRDPREVVVNSYFHHVLHNPSAVDGVESVDEFVVDMLPTICQWLSIRLWLFEEVMTHQTLSLWYNDALANPTYWHKCFLEFVGLIMPVYDVVAKAANIVAHGGQMAGFPSKGIDVHLAGGHAQPSRSYQSEVLADTLSGMDDVLRAWLPPALLEKFAVGPRN